MKLWRGWTFGILTALVLFFVLVRLPGLSIPFHQDEFKNVVAAEAGLEAASGFFTHPPLQAVLFSGAASVLGGEYIRLVPLFFSVLSALLLFFVVARRAGERAALFSVFLFAVSFYGVWGSLMVDVDGALLPTFFLAAVYSYDRFNESKKRGWLVLLVGALVLGMLTKLSFILVPAALFIDVCSANWARFSPAFIARLAFFTAGFFGLLGLSFMAAFIANPAFSLTAMVGHAVAYVGFDRAWIQILVQGLKAVFYLSPLLLVPLVFLSLNDSRSRIFWIYLIVGALFYFLLFDFSRGALDKYLLFAVIPLSALSGIALSEMRAKGSAFVSMLLGFVSGIFIVGLAFLPQVVVPLYPKLAWFTEIFSGRFAVLTPFTGGSGPAGFYVSFLIIAAGFVCSALAALIALWSPTFRRAGAVVILLVGLAYNGVFIEELMFGALYGNAARALEPALAYIANTESITQVVTYNDLGAYELTKLGKYAGRFYAAPQFEAGHQARFREHQVLGGHFLVAAVPALYDGFYTDFFASCDSLFKSHVGVIETNIYTCAIR